MGKTVTFSFNSTKYDGTEAAETFTFEQLFIDEDLDDKALIIDYKLSLLGFNPMKFNEDLSRESGIL